ncbi:MAG: hypothetical protein WCF11_13890, partial [Azonexus sp.]
QEAARERQGQLNRLTRAMKCPPLPAGISHFWPRHNLRRINLYDIFMAALPESAAFLHVAT